MQVWKNASMQVCNYASMQANASICKCAILYLFIWFFIYVHYICSSGIYQAYLHHNSVHNVYYICTILKILYFATLHNTCVSLNILLKSEAISNSFHNYDIIFAYLRVIPDISKAYLKNASSISYVILILLYRRTDIKSSYLFILED